MCCKQLNILILLYLYHDISGSTNTVRLPSRGTAEEIPTTPVRTVSPGNTTQQPRNILIQNIYPLIRRYGEYNKIDTSTLINKTSK